jgi:hypothetical protein
VREADNLIPVVRSFSRPYGQLTTIEASTACYWADFIYFFDMKSFAGKPQLIGRGFETQCGE